MEIVSEQREAPDNADMPQFDMAELRGDFASSQSSKNAGLSESLPKMELNDSDKKESETKTPEQAQMERDERYLQAIQEMKGLTPEKAKEKLNEEFKKLHELLKGKTADEASDAFIDFMEKNASRLYEMAKIFTKFRVESGAQWLNKMMEEAVLGTGFTAKATQSGIVTKVNWDRGVPHAGMGAAGYLDLCNSSGKILARAYIGKKPGY